MRGSLRRAAPVAWALVLAVLLLGDALGPGYALSYDMVWVPDLALGRDVLGLGTALPRAIPSDAVVAALDEVVGGSLLQKLVLLGMLVGAGCGFAALVGERSLGARLVAVTLGMWNPYVVERLLLGHWPLLIGYAVLPWLVVALRHGGDPARLLRRVLPLLVLGSLSASAGLMTALVALSLAGRGPRRRTVLLLAGLIGANAPWVVAGMSTPASSSSDPVGAVVFATADEGLMSGPVAALSFGGVWNADVVPGSRLGIAGLVLTFLLVSAAAAGIVRVRRGTHVRHLRALAVCWTVGWGSAVLSWAAPGALGWLGEHVPGGGLVRDGSRLLGLAVPLVVVLVAVAVDGVLERLPDRASRVVVAAALALVPVTLMPDAIWGMQGRLAAVAYPDAYVDARRAVASAPAGDAMSLPFESYRTPAWNGDRRVLDPLGRYLGRDTVVNDVLIVSGRSVAGEDPRAAAVRRALEAGGGRERSAALRAAGISVVVAESIAGYPDVDLVGEQVVDGDLSVTVLGPGATQPPPPGRIAAMALAWAAWLALLVATLAAMVRGRRRSTGARGGATGEGASGIVTQRPTDW